MVFSRANRTLSQRTAPQKMILEKVCVIVTVDEGGQICCSGPSAGRVRIENRDGSISATWGSCATEQLLMPF